MSIRMCVECKHRRALSSVRGRLKCSKGNDLCRRCYRSLVDSFHAWKLRARRLRWPPELVWWR